MTATYSRTAGETVGAYVISATLAPVAVLGNYNITPDGQLRHREEDGVGDTRGGGQDLRRGGPDVHRHAHGFLAADDVTATYSRTTGETVGAYVISATLAPAAVLGNYDITHTPRASTSRRRRRR